MITRVYRGTTPYGLVRYLFGEGRHEEHTDQHVIASWDGAPQELNPELAVGTGRHDVNRLVHLLEQPVHVRTQPMKADHVYHLVVRNDPGDRRLTDGEWGEICTEMMDRTGIAPKDDPAGCRWIAVRHADDHVHLVATLVREDGRLPRIAPRHKGRDFNALTEVAREFEDKFGLRSLRGRDDSTAAARPGRQEQAAAQKAGRTRAPREALRQQVAAAASSVSSMQEFTQLLEASGVTVWQRMSDRNPGEVTGYSVSINGHVNAAGDPIKFGGGKLAPDLSWPKLKARWADPTAESAEPATERAAQPPAWTDEQRKVWEDAERIVREAADRIRADAITDPEAAGDAAWAASDALSAAAGGFEGGDGGPLTDAAQAFERAGREQNRRTPRPTDSGRALRQCGRMITMLTAGNQHPQAAAAAIAIAMASLVSAVEDLRKAQRRFHQADAARAGALVLAGVQPVPWSPPAPPPGPPRAATAADVARNAMGGSLGVGPLRPRTARAKDPTAGDPATELRTGDPRRGRGQSHGR